MTNVQDNLARASQPRAMAHRNISHGNSGVLNRVNMVRNKAATWGSDAPTERILAYKIPAVPVSAWTAISSPRRVWLSRGLLLCILAIQAALSLRLRNTAFADEALLLYAGHLRLDQLRHGAPVPDTFTSHLSGSPLLYPVLGAAVDTVFGLAGARLLSLLFMVGTTALLYALTRLLFNERVALCAVAVFAVTQSTLFLGNFATFDGLALFLLALAAWIVVRTAPYRTWLACLLAAPALALAAAVKYAALMYLPVVVVLAVLAAFPHRRARALLRGLALPVLVAAIWAGALAAGGSTHLDALRSTLQRATGRDDPLGLLLDSLQWAGPLLAIAVLGTVLYVRRGRLGEAPGIRNAAVPGRWWRVCLGLLLCGTALLAPAYRMHLHTGVSLHNDIGYGLFFAAPMAGVGMTRLIGAHFRHPQFGPLIWVPLLILGMTQSQDLYHAWPNSTELVATLRSQLVPGGHYLVEAGAVPRYYLREQTQPSQWTTTYAINYYPGSGGILLTGEPAYRAAITDGYFDIIVFDRTVTKELDAKLTEQLRTEPNYRLLTKLPFTDSRGGGAYQIWVKIQR